MRENGEGGETKALDAIGRGEGAKFAGAVGVAFSEQLVRVLVLGLALAYSFFLLS